MGTRLTITPAPDFCLARDACSNGLTLLAPNRWRSSDMTLARLLTLEEGVAAVVVSQRGAKPEDRSTWGAAVQATFDRKLSKHEQAQAKQQLVRMLRMDETLETLHRVDPRWRWSGRGRIARSPTFFEDVIKVITTCNVQWSGTVAMNASLCALAGGAFPTPQQLARCKPATLRSRCRVGYRDRSLIAAAKLFARGEVEEASLADRSRSDEEVERSLRALPGVGPYAAAHLLAALGRYSKLAIDTEALKHGRATLGFSGEEAVLRAQVEAHYERFGGERFRVYWLELFREHERAHGPCWSWSDGSTLA